jgi:hypothetical protein
MAIVSKDIKKEQIMGSVNRCPDYRMSTDPAHLAKIILSTVTRQLLGEINSDPHTGWGNTHNTPRLCF